MKVRLGIRRKMELFILPIITIAFVIVIAVAYSISKKSIEQKTIKLLEAEAASSANSIEAWQNHNLSILNNAVDTMLHQKMNREALLEYETMFLDKYTDFPDGLYIVCDDGSVVDCSGWIPESDPRESTYYIEGIKCKSGAEFVEAYIDDFTGQFVVTAASYVPDINGIGGIVCSDISLSIMSEVIAGMKIEGEGDAFIVDTSTGTILAHKDSSLLGAEISTIPDSFYSEVSALVANPSEKYRTISSTDGKYMVSYEYIENTNWCVVVRALEKNIYSDLTKLGFILAAMGIIVIIIIVFTLIILIKKITNPINKLTDVITSITDGDFTVEAPVSGNDEVAVMSASLNSFLNTMRETLGNLIKVSDTIDRQASDSSNTAAELFDSANGQSEAMEQMLIALEEFVKSITSIAEDATTLAMIASDTDAAGVNAINNIESTMNMATSGRKSLRLVTDSMDSMKSSMDTLEKSISDVGESAVKIDNITSTIREIAEQTNLLSLNASIEAARAGESGKGFAVVATEIKGLAETSAAAADEISELISTVTRLIKETVELSDHSMSQIKQSSELADDASEQFNNIFSSIEDVNQIIHSMIDKIHTTNDVASNMAAVTQEQSASAEEIEATAVSVQELANTVTNNSSNVKNNASELSDTSNELNERIGRFKI